MRNTGAWLLRRKRRCSSSSVVQTRSAGVGRPRLRMDLGGGSRGCVMSRDAENAGEASYETAATSGWDATTSTFNRYTNPNKQQNPARDSLAGFWDNSV